jgi:two-component system, cell cycle sensor histidine kinase and response regulator CckA
MNPHKSKPLDAAELRRKAESMAQEKDADTIRELLEKYRQLVENSLQGLSIIQDERFVFCNSAFATMTGYSVEELLSFPHSMVLVHPEDRAAVHGRHGDRIAGRPVSDQHEHRIIKKDGTVRWMEVRASFMEYNGRPAVQVVNMDITERKQTEEALRESERNYREIFDSASDAIFVHDAETGAILDVNASVLQMFGINREMALALRPNDTSLGVSPYSELEVKQWLMKALTEGPQVFDWQARRMDGKLFWAEVSLKRAVIGGQKRVLALIRDITERKRAEEALRQSEERLRLAQKATNDVVWEWDAIHDTQQWNESGKVVFGWTDIVEHPQSAHWWVERIHPEDLQRVSDGFFAAVNNPEADYWYGEYRFRKADGVYAQVMDRGYILRDKQGKALRMIGALLDITERKRAEEELKQSESKYRCLYQNMRDAFATVDMSGRIQEFNRAFVDLLGYTEDKLRSMTYVDLTPAKWHAVEADLMRTQIFPRGYSDLYEKEYRRKDGTPISVEMRTTLMRDENGNPISMWAIVRDITERKKAEEEKTKLQAQLQQAQKMESVGRLAGGVAHDFNNMLGVILGHAEIALGQIDPNQPLYDDLTEIHKAAQRSADLTRQLLAFARKQTVTPKVLDLNETVSGMLKMLQRIMGENINLSWHPSENLWPVKIDPSQIDQILANLCVNARDAIEGVGKVTIETQNSALDETYCAAHTGSVSGEYVMLAVSDNGYGMNKETLAQIFEPFFTTKKLGKGTGLGLATVYGIIKQNKGFINAYSEPNQGTTFRIYLPRHMGKVEQARAAGTAEWVIRGHETILLAEDEPSILNMTTRALELHGYTVLPASTPGEAIRIAEKHGGDIHLLMTDVVMPEMNGRDLAKNLLSMYPHIKRLFTSGYTADVIAHQGVLDEGVHFLQKPFSVQDLAVKVREVLDKV